MNSTPRRSTNRQRSPRRPAACRSRRGPLTLSGSARRDASWLRSIVHRHWWTRRSVRRLLERLRATNGSRLSPLGLSPGHRPTLSRSIYWRIGWYATGRSGPTQIFDQEWTKERKVPARQVVPTSPRGNWHRRHPMPPKSACSEADFGPRRVCCSITPVPPAVARRPAAKPMPNPARPHQHPNTAVTQLKPWLRPPPERRSCRSGKRRATRPESNREMSSNLSSGHGAGILGGSGLSNCASVEG